MAYKKFTNSAAQLKPDARYNKVLVSKFINCTMMGGKKSTATRNFYDAMDIIGKRITDTPPEEVFEQAVQNTSIPKLEVLVCGPIPDSPAEMVGGVRFKQLLNRLADRYDEIILDSPPLGPVADGCVIAATCHGTVVVVRAGSTQRKALNAATRDLEKVGADILGIIINRAKRGLGGYDQQYAYERGQQSKETQGNGTSSDTVQPVASASADQPPSTS